MRIDIVRCPTLGTNVTRVVDFEGWVDHVICPEYRRADGSCRLKRAVARDGPLSRLLHRVGDDLAVADTVTCSLR